MKARYERYGRKTQQLEEQLTDEDREILGKFLNVCRMNAGEGRIRKYRCYLLQFRDLVEKPYDDVTRDDAIAYWGLVRHSEFEEHTRIDMRRIVKRFLKWHFRDLEMVEPLKVNSSHLFNSKKINKAVLITEDEFRRLLHSAERLRDKALLVLFYETGARPHEIRQLRWSDIDWPTEEVHLHSNKTDSARDLPLKEALPHLRRWYDEFVIPNPQESDYIFPSTHGSRCDPTRPVSVTYIGRIFRSLGKKAGITRTVYPYLFRHTRLTHIRKCGIQGSEFKQFAGHKPTSHQEAVYVHLDNEDMKQSVLRKVYKAKELPRGEREQYEDRIKELEMKMSRLIDIMTEVRQVASRMSKVSQKRQPEQSNVYMHPRTYGCDGHVCDMLRTERPRTISL